VVLVSALAACGRVGFETRDDGGTGAADTDALTYRELVLSDDPVGYWRLSSTSGIVADELGAFPGTLTGVCNSAPGLITADTDLAIEFSPLETCCVDLGPTLAFEGVAPWTIEVWAQWDLSDRTGAFQHLFTRQTRSGGPVNGYALVYSEDDAGYYAERINATMSRDTARIARPAGVVMHLVAVFDGASIRLYVDGVERTMVADTSQMPPHSASAKIGCGPDPADPLINFWTGVLDEVAVYDHALAPSRIARHYEVGATGP